MAVRIRKPTRRVCEYCGRVEAYDDEVGAWRVEEVGGPHCIHEWDINGSFVPFEDADGS